MQAIAASSAVPGLVTKRERKTVSRAAASAPARARQSPAVAALAFKSSFSLARLRRAPVFKRDR